MGFIFYTKIQIAGEPVSLVVYRGAVRHEFSVTAERLPELIPSTWFARPS